MPRHPQLEAIGKKIRQARTAKQKGSQGELAQKRWSQDGFATELGIARSYYGGVERGERNLSVLKLLEIVVALEADLADILPPTKELKKLARKRELGRRSTT